SPAVTVAIGHVTKIDPVSAGRCVLSYANGNFSPFHKYEVTFEQLTLPDGQQLTIQTTVSRGVTEVVHLVSHPEQEEERKKSAAARVASDTKNEASNTVHQTLDQIRSPGRLARLKRFLLARAPYRRQYIELGTRFDASLDRTLDFGTTTRTVDELAQLGGVPPPESLVHARLLIGVSSAT